jgi:RHS repeat-associated protein
MYNYKYQGQELQETGFYSFKWRNYMPDVGRFFNVDPLAEKYPYWTPYAFSGNRVVDAREIEGLEPHVLFNTRENAALNFGQQYNGKSIKQYREYAATIYAIKKSDGKTYYAYNKPSKGGNAGATPNSTLPKNARATAIIHSHGGYESNYKNNEFSGQNGDKGYAEYHDLDIFVSTPNGSLKYYDVSSNSEKTVTTKLPSDPNDPDRQNTNPPVENPNPSSGDYKPKPIKVFPDPDTSSDKPKPVLDGGLKSIEDRRREQLPIRDFTPPRIN